MENYNNHVLVHMTNYFPLNHRVSTPHSVLGERTLRDTIHFTLNCAVEDIGGFKVLEEQSWKEEKYGLLLPMVEVLKERDGPERITTCDTFFIGDVPITANSRIISGKPAYLDLMNLGYMGEGELVHLQEGEPEIRKRVGRYDITIVNPNVDDIREKVNEKVGEMGFERRDMGEAYPVHQNHWTRYVELGYGRLMRGIQEAGKMLSALELYGKGKKDEAEKIIDEVLSNHSYPIKWSEKGKITEWLGDREGWDYHQVRLEVDPIFAADIPKAKKYIPFFDEGLKKLDGLLDQLNTKLTTNPSKPKIDRWSKVMKKRRDAGEECAYKFRYDFESC